MKAARYLIAFESEATMLSGLKTYLFAILIALVNALFAGEVIGAKLYAILMGFLGSGGLASLRVGVQKAENKADAAATASAEAASAANKVARAVK